MYKNNSRIVVNMNIVARIKFSSDLKKLLPQSATILIFTVAGNTKNDKL